MGESTGEAGERRGSARALARAMAAARSGYSEARRSERAARRARMLRGLEQSLFGSRMPEARTLVLHARWSRESLDTACPRCGVTRATFEDVRRGCAECRGRSLGYDGFVRLGRYAPPLSQWVPAVKARAWKGMAEVLGEELGRQVRDAVAADRIDSPDLIAFIPTHWLRRMLRGIDHGACLAEAAARVLGAPVAPLLRTSLAQRQTGSDRSHRSGRSERFTLPAVRRGCDSVAGKCVLLIDDVRTTGSTLREASFVLKKAGARSVVAACCAATDPPNRRGAVFGAASPR